MQLEETGQPGASDNGYGANSFGNVHRAVVTPLTFGKRMKTVPLAKVEIDENGWMRLYPVQEVYDFIYRAAAGVDWDKKGGFLHAREPGEWTYLIYFKQIVSVVVSEYGDLLQTRPETEWLKVPDDVRKAIESSK